MTRNSGTRRIILAVVGTIAILILLFSYRTSLGGGVAAEPSSRAHIVSGATGATTHAGQGPEPRSATAPTTRSVPSSSVPSSQPPSPTAPSSPAAAAPLAVDGDTEATPYGPMQVKVTVTSGRITDVTAIQYPNGQGQSRQINSNALPRLRSEVLSAQSAKVDAVSGATYTTQSYVASLQSALDAAHFGS